VPFAISSIFVSRYMLEEVMSSTYRQLRMLSAIDAGWLSWPRSLDCGYGRLTRQNECHVNSIYFPRITCMR
jgi:hypothetical protein